MKIYLNNYVKSQKKQENRIILFLQVVKKNVNFIILKIKNEFQKSDIFFFLK